MCTSEFNGGGNPAMDQHPIQGGVENTPSCFVPQKLEISAGLMGHLAYMQALLFVTQQDMCVPCGTM